MKDSKTNKIDAKGEPWFPLLDCCRAFDVTRQTFNATYRGLVADDAVRTVGGRVEINLRVLIDAYVTKELAKVPASTSPTDPLLSGPNSPALEEYRQVRTARERIQLEREQGTHISTTDVEADFTRIGDCVRRAVEAQQRRFGPECASILNEALDDSLATWKGPKAS